MNWIQQARGRARAALARFCRRVVLPAALRRFRRPEAQAGGVEVHTLASEKTFDAALLAFASLELHSQRRWSFVLHEDGSLGEGAYCRLAELFPDARWVTQAEADARASEALAALPRCLQHRGTHNLALKYFDTPLFAREGRWVLLDADVVFFREPGELLSWVEERDERSFYNEDTREKFCLPRAMIESHFPCHLPPMFNSGLVLYPGLWPGFERAEEFLNLFENEAHAPQFIEQTLWAIAAGSVPAGAQPLPRTYNISWGYWRERGSAARHYVGDFKHDLLYIEGAPLMLAALMARRSAPQVSKN